jgi:hypothetical protein
MAKKIATAAICTLIVMVIVGCVFVSVLPERNVFGVLLCVMPIVAGIGFPLVLILQYLAEKGILFIPV